ncbi:MAG TPA: hypothetical protein VGG54_12230 [Trebonia sp.]|jgi:hypothetical protein
MYELSNVAKQMHFEQLERAQSDRNARRLRALQRNQRVVLRAERRMSQAHNEVLRLRWELEAES